MLNNFITRLKNLNISNPEQEFKWLACHALNINSAQLLTRDFSEQDFNILNKFIVRREQGEPLQYIINSSSFYGRDFITGPGSLIPRQDTESLINAALELFNNNLNLKFLDWGTGTGCIAITLLLEFQNSFAFMLDKSQDALKYARQNLAKYNLKDRAELLLNLEDSQDNFRIFKPENFANNLDLIISNPPYIASNQIQHLMREVRDYEPHSALDGGTDGLDYYKIIFKLASSSLKDQGCLILEIGDYNQADYLKDFNNNFKFIKAFQDNSGFPRCMAFVKL
ncbi:MAG: peptide chain release factor N(5)-glutamine methyltransferase [Synergistaceae bacterium]|nr:peptide chain release factor N(5)-glutamine methyltransferase [Synergistaceae bacterium]